MATISKTYFSKLTGINRIDSEYFNPEYLNLERILSQIKTVPITALTTISDGNHMSISKYFTDNDDGVPYFRGQDINDFFLENAEPYKITKEAFYKGWMYRSHFKPGDVLLSIVGTVGSLAYVTDRINECTGSCKIAILRPRNKIDGRFLSAFLKSKYGQFQIKRNVRGAVQTGLILKDMVFIKVPEVDYNIQLSIANLVQKSIDENSVSKTLYTQATQLLDEALGLNNIQFKKEKSYKASFSEVITNNRADAEFYDTKYNPYLEKINVFEAGTVPLLQCCERVTPNYNPKTERLNEIFYIEIGDISIADGAFQFKKIKTKEAPANAKIALKGGEILLSMVRPTRGAITIVPDDLPEGRVVCSGAFYVFNPKSPEHREIIWLYLRLLKHCFEKYCGGTSYPTIEPKYISFFPIPQFDLVVANEIKKLITDSTDARNKSELLLEQAKKEVETLIEQAANQS